MSKSKLIGVLFDVSGSMKEPYDIISNKNYSIESKSQSLIDILTNLTNNLKIDIFTLLFGSKDGMIIDFLFLVKNIISYLQNLNEHFYDPKEEFIHLMERYGPTSLHKYLYDKYGPTNEEVAFACTIIKKKESLGRKIFNHLPYQVKHSSIVDQFVVGNLVSGYNGLSHIFSRFGNAFSGKGFVPSESDIDKEVIEQIKLTLKECVEEIIEDIFNNMRKDNIYIKNIMKINSEMLKQMLKEMDNLIKSKIPLRANNNNNVMDLIKKIIYGNTPLNSVIQKAFSIYSECKNQYEKKVLLIITDGESTDGDPTDFAKQQSINNEVYIIGCYISTKYCTENTFYDQKSFNINEEGAKKLFKMCSNIEYKNPLFRFFLKRGWNMPQSGECKLFVSLNNSNTLNEFVSLINHALNYKDLPSNGLMDIISTSAIHSFVNSYSNENFGARNQIFGTCWANACAACIHFANKRILGRKNISFEDIRKHLIINYSNDNIDGNNIDNALNNIYNDYKLRMKEVDEKNARLAVMKGRPCIASFSLTAKQWANFSGFFKENRTKYLDEATINKKDYPKEYYSTGGGHAVVLIEVSHEGLTFLNSWGMSFGDFGKFRIKNTNVLTEGEKGYKMRFFDVFFIESDLSSYEKNYYKENHEKYVSNTLSYLIGSEDKITELMNKNIKCEKCNNYSKAQNYKGNILIVKCPICHMKYEPLDKDLKNCVYLKEILPGYENFSLDNIEIMNELNAERIKKSNKEILCDKFTSSVNMLLILSDKRLCACSSDCSIKIFNIIKSNNFDLEINMVNAHTDKIWCIDEIQYQILASGAFKDIKIWRVNKDNLSLIMTINNAHDNYLNKIIKLNNNEFASCSRDGKIKLWKNNYTEKKTINAHNTYINNILKIKNILISGSNGEKCIKFWDLENYNLIKTYDNIYATAYNNSLLLVDNNLFVGEKDGIRIFRFNYNNHIEAFFYEDKDLERCLSLCYLGNNIIMSGSTTGFIYLYRIIKNKDITLENVNVIRNNSLALKGRYNYAVSCLAFMNERGSYIISGSIDGIIKMYRYYII